MTRPVLQLTRELVAPPVLPEVPGVVVRTWGGEEDIARWLRLRAAAFADEPRAVRPWTAEDFRAQLLTQRWWHDEHCWLAEAGGTLVGAVILAARGPENTALPAVHWLMVDPGWRRGGVAGLLMACLEHRCWQSGERTIVLETHGAWESAVGFYRARGYRD